MNPRRRVERFSGGRFVYRRQETTYEVQITVNGETEPFHLKQPIPRSVIFSITNCLGRRASMADLEGMVKARIQDWVAVGGIDDWPPAVPQMLPPIYWQNIPPLLEKAGLDSDELR